MRAIQEIRSRWDLTFASNGNLSDLRVAVRSGSSSNPCEDGLRSVCWKAFLVFENLDRSTWPKTIHDSRGAYNSLKEHFLRDITNSDSIIQDPLADDANSPWNTLRQDETLRAEIFQDVERCLPDNPFYREPATQAIMTDILFVFCKLNADVGYRQGMHEVLAPILWVISQDAMDLKEREDTEGEPAEMEGLMESVLNQKYIEHDAFTLYCIVMQTAKSFYETASNSQHSTKRASENSPIVERSKRIHEDYLRRTDKELTKHLTAVEILPQIFVIRWIRLLFGREFPFEDVLSLWDVLFAEDPGLDLVDLICVAMLLRIRWQLLEADYSSALTLLLRYPVPPEPHGPRTLVEDALYLRGNLNSQGGAQLVNRYTGRPIKSNVQRPSLGRPMHTPQGSRDSLRTKSPLRSPSQFLAESGGIENILQDAAKGAFRQGEKWGSSLRGAIQQLQQQANTSPRRSVGNIRWSIDSAQSEYSSDQLGHKVKALEERNKTLAKMLQDAMEELSSQAKLFEDRKAEDEANALTLSIAKLHFVHVYLENSTLPLNEGQEPQDQDDGKTENNEVKFGSGDRTSAPASSSPKAKARDSSPRHLSGSPSRSKPVRRRPTSITPNNPTNQADSKERAGSPFHHSRPTLADSSFSWMLGDGDGHRSKSNFVSVAPLAPEQMRKNNKARVKAGFLFGEDAAESAGDGKVEDKEDEDGFTLGTLKGAGR